MSSKLQVPCLAAGAILRCNNLSLTYVPRIQEQKKSEEEKKADTQLVFDA
jgi:hypothetical protein